MSDIQGVSKVRSDLFSLTFHYLFNVKFQKKAVVLFAYFSFDHFNY